MIPEHINMFRFPRIVERTDDMHETEEGHQKWLALRRDYIGGSEAAAALGLSRYQTKAELYVEKTELTAPREETEKMWAGKMLEPVIAEMFVQRTGKHVVRQPFFYCHPVHSFMGANIDFGVFGENAGLECKNTNNRYFISAGYVPDEYFLQCHHYMAVTGASRWYLAYLLEGWKFDYVEIERDESLTEMIIAGESDFWENHVIPRTPPSEGEKRRRSGSKSRTRKDKAL